MPSGMDYISHPHSCQYPAVGFKYRHYINKRFCNKHLYFRFRFYKILAMPLGLILYSSVMDVLSELKLVSSSSSLSGCRVWCLAYISLLVTLFVKTSKVILLPRRRELSILLATDLLWDEAFLFEYPLLHSSWILVANRLSIFCSYSCRSLLAALGRFLPTRWIPLSYHCYNLFGRRHLPEVVN